MKAREVSINRRIAAVRNGSQRQPTARYEKGSGESRERLAVKAREVSINRRVAAVRSGSQRQPTARYEKGSGESQERLSAKAREVQEGFRMRPSPCSGSAQAARSG